MTTRRAMIAFDAAAARKTVSAALVDCHEAAREFLAPTSPATQIPGARPESARSIMTEREWLAGMPSIALSKEWRLAARNVSHDVYSRLVMVRPTISAADAVTPAYNGVAAFAPEKVLNLLVEGEIGRGQPARILRTLRRIEAFAAKLRRLAEGRQRAAARILNEQASAIETLEAAATLRVLGGGPRT